MSASKVAVLSCKGCGACDNVCPLNAILKVDGKAVIDYKTCNNCLKCVDACQNKSIVVVD